MIHLADLANDIRLAVDSGETAIGINSVEKSIKSNTAKVIVLASNNKKETAEDLMHLAKIANIRVLTLKGNSMDLGAICGKPFSVSAVSVINAGNSKILEENY
ncbi:MAG TPA: 50S ribosomal protein L30e [Candidatus Baltobacteraceae bacterium]|nr:50S ribosomal protein L30e [Candidatus Baltobacteraceae bacterium]